MVSEVSSDKARNDNQDTKVPMQEPWSKWVKMQQQLMAAVKGAQSAPKKTSNRVPMGLRGGIVRVPVPVVKGPSGKATDKIVILPETTEPRPEGEMIKIRLNAIAIKGGGICVMSAQAIKI